MLRPRPPSSLHYPALAALAALAGCQVGYLYLGSDVLLVGAGGAGSGTTNSVSVTASTAGTGGATTCTTSLDGGDALWSRGYSAVGASVGGAGLAIDASGNIVFAGEFAGSVDFGCGALNGTGAGNVFLAKLAPSGACLWSEGFSGGAKTQIGGAAVDGSGNIVLTGAFDGSVDFGTSPLTSMAGLDVFVARFDSEGKPAWSKSYGSGVSQGQGVAADAAGNAVVMGYFQGSIDFGGTTPVFDGGAMDALFLVDLDPSGTPVWSKGLEDAATTGVAVDGSGNFFVTGEFTGAVDFGGCPLTAKNPIDGFVVKLDPSGACVWGTSLGAAVGTGIAVGSSGDAVVTGLFDGAGGCGLTGTGPQDGFLLRLDPSGACAWGKSLGAAVGLGVAVDASGNIFITGALDGSVDLGGGLLTNTGSEDILIASFTADGSYRWAEHFGNNQKNLGGALAVDPSCHVVVVGGFEGTLDIGGNPLVTTSDAGSFIAELAR